MPAHVCAAHGKQADRPPGGAERRHHKTGLRTGGRARRFRAGGPKAHGLTRCDGPQVGRIEGAPRHRRHSHSSSVGQQQRDRGQAEVLVDRRDDLLQQVGHWSRSEQTVGQVEQLQRVPLALAGKCACNIKVGNDPGDHDRHDHVDTERRPPLGRADRQGAEGLDEEDVVCEEATYRAHETGAGAADDGGSHDRDDQHEARGGGPQLGPQRHHRQSRERFQCERRSDPERCLP